VTTLVTAGVFDVLHKNHRIFLSSLITKANANSVLILLASDQVAAQLKGIERPFFEYKERQLDIRNFFDKHYSSVNLRFKEAKEFKGIANLCQDYLGKNNYIVGLKNQFDYVKRNSKLDSRNLITLEEQPGEHTSSISFLLHSGELLSKCTNKKMAAVLTRNGSVISVGQNGVSKDSLTRIYQEVHCGKCPVGRCNYKSAEELVLYEDLPKDELFVSYSPNLHIAQLIMKVGINRVVYLQESENLDGVEFLKANKVKIKKAGVYYN
jgi:deoxycytidylate deaminase/glycerol-3-phosphate cytidylyltransferase-like family protein